MLARGLEPTTPLEGETPPCLGYTDAFSVNSREVPGGGSYVTCFLCVPSPPQGELSKFFLFFLSTRCVSPESEPLWIGLQIGLSKASKVMLIFLEPEPHRLSGRQAVQTLCL